VKLILFTVIFSILPIITPANPINPHIYPAISEVQWIDSANWAIELDNTAWAKINHTLFCDSLFDPCTTTAIRLFLTSSGRTYSTRVVFNDSGLGVITPSSITGISDTEQVLIRSIDSIFIPDPGYTTESIRSLIPYDGWLCPINKPISGTSLIGCEGGTFVSSSRSSIGTRGNYSTIHHLYVIDRDDHLISWLYPYSVTSGHTTRGYPMYTYSSTGYTDTNGVITFTAGIGSDQTLSLFDYSIGSSYTYEPIESGDLYGPFYVSQCTWGCNYVDSATECNDTLYYKPNYQKIRIVDPAGIPVEGLNSHPRGKETVTGEFLFSLFPGYSYSIQFVSSNVTVAACTCSYIDTKDTLTRTITSTQTSITTPSKSNSGNANISDDFSIIGYLPGGNPRFIISAHTSFRHGAIIIYTANGRIVASISLPSKASGTHTLRWNGTTLSGEKLSPGNYMCKFTIDGTTFASRTVPVF
jgi:hypothetical protein